MSEKYSPYITKCWSIFSPDIISPLSICPLAIKKQVPVSASQELPLPQLSKLMELRNALVALKGPLANEPGLRESIENQLFNNETNDRVLGKPAVGPPRMIEYWPHK